MTQPMIHVALLDTELPQDTFLKWYGQEHLTQVLTRSGWLGARCYTCLRGEPRILTVFDVDADLPKRGAVSASPFAGGFLERRGIRNYHARTYKQIHEAGSHVTPPTLINAVTVDIEEPRATAFSEWYNTVHFPEMLTCPGWIGGRRYEAIDGQPRFLAIYDLEDAERPFHSPQFDAAVGWDDFAADIRGFHGFRIYEMVWDSYAI
jgi:hypothetical protein